MIIAVDFDGILATDEGTFPEIGEPVYDMISFTRELIDKGHEVVLWTSRTDSALDMAVTWCEDRGLRFVAVNDNAPSNKAKYESMFPNGTRKVSADIYIDDHNVGFIKSYKSNGFKRAISQLIQDTRRILWEREP